MTVAKNISGKCFGRLTVLHRAGSNRRGLALWHCSCQCGNLIATTGADLRSGHTQSCGCLRDERAAAASSAANRKHGLADTPIYAVWRGMVARCTDQRRKFFPAYGGRGIFVCDEWLLFDRFYTEFGASRPSQHHTIDRIDNNDGYRPGNVRWALPEQQQNNRRDNVRITRGEETLTLSQWARRVGISPQGLAYRLRRGWPLQTALSLPPAPNRRLSIAPK